MPERRPHGWVCAKCKTWHEHGPIGICACFRTLTQFEHHYAEQIAKQPRPPVEPFPAPPSRVSQALEEAMIDLEYAKAQRAQRQMQRLAEGHQRAQDERTDEVLAVMLAAIDALRGTVQQMNSVLVEMRKLGEPRVVEFPARALRHGSPR